MDASGIPDAATAAVIHAFRQDRLRAGLKCTVCRSTRIVRWGTFSGRQRYRCSHCWRTFSDLTGTAVSHLKRLDLWHSFCSGIEATETIRAGARRLGVHPSTTFRLRHRLLASLRCTDTNMLAGDVIVGVSFVKYSQKGSRAAFALQYDPSSHTVFGYPAVWLVVACGGAGVVVAEPVWLRRPGSRDVRRFLQWRLDDGAVLLSREGRAGIVAGFAAGSRRQWRPLGPEGLKWRGGSPAHAYVLRFRRWLRRFRGIASRYLVRYLAWHRRSELNGGLKRGSREDLLVGRFPAITAPAGSVGYGDRGSGTSANPLRDVGGD